MSDVLLLNFTYEAMDIVDFKRAFRLVMAGKAEMLHHGDAAWRSMAETLVLPSIVRMLYYVKRRKNGRVALTKKNVLLRDDYRCAYCREYGGREMTVDHVTPRAQGGPSTWTNLVACCMPCNSRKRDRTPAQAAMPLRREPREPRFIPFRRVQRHTIPEEWAMYLTLYNVSIGREG